MVEVLKAYRTDGSTRGIWTDRTGDNFRKLGLLPQRASRVEAIADGPHRSQFHVDFSLLAEAIQDPTYAVCLVQTFNTHSAAVAAEVLWLRQHWMLAPRRDSDA